MWESQVQSYHHAWGTGGHPSIPGSFSPRPYQWGERRLQEHAREGKLRTFRAADQKSISGSLGFAQMCCEVGARLASSLESLEHLQKFSSESFPELYPQEGVFLSLPPSAPLPMQHYFCDAWNTFDALIVVGSIVDIAITEVNVSTGVPPCDAVPASRSPPSLSFASSPPPSSFPLHYSHLFV